MNVVKKEPGPCQVRSRTDRPCTHPAVVEIYGVPFCERHAREQEAYFAIGELTREEQGVRDELLIKMLGRMRQGYTEHAVEAGEQETGRRRGRRGRAKTPRRAAVGPIHEAEEVLAMEDSA